MARKVESVAKSFQEFLKAAPSLDDAASDDSVELTGLVTRTTEGRFAITTDGGQTYELDVEAVRDFRAEEAGGASAATIRIGREAMQSAVLRQVKPTVKDMIKDPIKDIICDGKQMITDPAVDHKSPLKDAYKDPLTDPPKPLAKDPPWDPPKFPWKEMYKDPLDDPTTFVPEGLGTGPGDAIFPDPRIDPTVNPAVNFAAAQAAPFVMATPHHAPQHLIDLQFGAQAATNFKVDKDSAKEMPFDSYKEVHTDTKKEFVAETYKELHVDTHKEPPWDPQTLQEQAGIAMPHFGRAF